MAPNDQHVPHDAPVSQHLLVDTFRCCVTLKMSTCCCACDEEDGSSRRTEVGEMKVDQLTSTKDAVLADRSDVAVAVGVALCVIVVAIATTFVWHSSRHVDCGAFRFAAASFKMAPSAVAAPPRGVVVADTGNSNSAAAKVDTTTPSSGAVLVPNDACCPVHGRCQPPRSPAVEPRVVIGRSASRDRAGARDDGVSASTSLHVSLNRLPLGELLTGPTNYIPYRLKQSYC